MFAIPALAAEEDTPMPEVTVTVTETSETTTSGGISTTATPNYNYTMENVADATYYGASESAHIQAIGMYGYWGTSGNATGSLKTLKANLTASRKEAAKKGQSFYLTQKQIDALTEGEALTATQAAFWTFGNGGSTTIGYRSVSFLRCSSGVTERVREVAISTAPSTHCPWGHPHKLQYEPQYSLPALHT